MKANMDDADSAVPSSLWDDVRPFYCLVMLGILGLSGFSAAQFYQYQTAFSGFMCGTPGAVLSVAWLYFGFPVGVVCLAIQFGVPGSGRRTHWFPVLLAALFALSTAGWLGFGSWWFRTALGEGTMFFDSLWWLHPISWLCA